MTGHLCSRVPGQSSLSGAVHGGCRYRLHIVGEVTVDVRHCLMALPGVQKEDLRRVQSHPQALSQCDNYLRNMKGVVREAVSDTAGAAQAIAQQGIRCATASAAALLHRALPLPVDLLSAEKHRSGSTAQAALESCPATMLSRGWHVTEYWLIEERDDDCAGMWRLLLVSGQQSFMG